MVVKWAEPNLENTRLYIFKPFPLQKIIKFLIIAIALCAKAKASCDKGGSVSQQSHVESDRDFIGRRR